MQVVEYVIPELNTLYSRIAYNNLIQFGIIVISKWDGESIKEKYELKFVYLTATGSPPLNMLRQFAALGSNPNCIVRNSRIA